MTAQFRCQFQVDYLCRLGGDVLLTAHPHAAQRGSAGGVLGRGSFDLPLSPAVAIWFVPLVGTRDVVPRGPLYAMQGVALSCFDHVGRR